MDAKIIPIGPDELATFLASLPQMIEAYEITLVRKGEILKAAQSAFAELTAETQREIGLLEHQLDAARTILASAQQSGVAPGAPLIVH